MIFAKDNDLPKASQRCLIPNRSRDCSLVFLAFLIFGAVAGLSVHCLSIFLASIVIAALVTGYVYACLTRAAIAACRRLNSMSELLAELGHELANPIAASRARVQFIAANKANYGDADFEQLLELNSRMAVVVEDLRVLARARNPRYGRPMFVSRADCVARKCADEMQHVFALKEVDLRIDAGEPAPLACNEESIKRIITNLLSNALRHSVAGGVVVLTIERQKSSHITITVEDNGLGISKEDLPYVFDRFYRSSENHPGTGLGLGLAIVKAEVDSLNGEITVESEKGKGTRVCSVLPAFPPVHPAFSFWTQRHALKL